MHAPLEILLAIKEEIKILKVQKRLGTIID
jgi:hypothetical protein